MKTNNNDDMKEQEQKPVYCFGTDQERCGPDDFDTIEELIAFADACYKDPDGDYWDDCADEYPQVIFIGISHSIVPKDFAPSLDSIADQMTDSFYCEHNIDDDAEVQIKNRKEAQEAWDAFVDKFFEMPHSKTCTWIGEYDIKEHKWLQVYGKEVPEQ